MIGKTCNYYIYLSIYFYSSNNENINIKQQIVDFFHMYFIKADYPEKDIVIRFFLPLIQNYINYYKAFDNPLLECWKTEIRPFILEKYPQSETQLFYANSDIHYITKLIENLRETYEVKTEINNNNTITSLPINLEKKEEKDIKELRRENKSKISSFLENFIEENKIKRSNSMMSLRQSKTFSSFTTCDSSICGDEIKDKKQKINLNLLFIDNSEINQKNKKTKDMIQRSKNLSEALIGLDLKKESKQTKNKFGKLAGIGMDRPQTLNLIMSMSPQFKENEEEMEGINIEYSDNNKKIINNISVDLLLNKIIFDNFLEINTLLIYHFCQQCFCFVNKEVLFKKLFNCYKIYKDKNVPLNQLKNLIEFINITVLELLEYYEKVDFNEMKIGNIKKFYNELILDLINNFNEKENNNNNENKIIIDNNNKTNIEITPNKEITEENNALNNNEKKYNRINLINDNLNIDVKNINIFIYQDKENTNNNDNNLTEIKSSNKFRISKTLRTSFGAHSPKEKSPKLLNNIFDDIREEKDEDNIYSDNDDNENSEDEEKNEIKSEKEDSLEMVISPEDEENEDINKTEIINNFLNKVFINNNNDDKILSIKDELLFEIYYIISLLDIKDKDIISRQRILEAKLTIPFYLDIKIKKKKDLCNNNDIHNNNNIKINKYEKSRTNNMYNSFNKSNNISNFNINNKKYFCITDWSTEEIANKLTQVSKSLLDKICPRELYLGVYLKKDKEKTSPNVVNCINNFNNFTSFIIEDIISYNTPKLRARVYEKWVQICEHCKNNKNYNDCIAIFSALNNYIITGLRLTMKEVKSKTKNIFEQINNFCSCEGNYKNIRIDMNSCLENDQCFIPYLGMLLRDINFLEESSKYINEKGCVNMDKIEKMNALLEKYFKYKNYDIKKNEFEKLNRDLNFFEKLEPITEEALEKIANDIEPEMKLDKQDNKRLTNIDLKYFAQKFKGRSTISGTKNWFFKKTSTFNFPS